MHLFFVLDVLKMFLCDKQMSFDCYTCPLIMRLRPSCPLLEQ